MNNIFGNILVAIAALGIALLLFGIGSLLLAIPVYFLWNAVVPVIFGLPVITYVQTLLLLWLLCFLRLSYASTNVK